MRETSDRTNSNGVRYFCDHNGSRVDYPAGTKFSDGYVQPSVAGVTATESASVLSHSDITKHDQRRQSVGNWNLRQDSYTFEWVIRPDWRDDGTVPFVITVTGEQAKETAMQIITEHNQHTALVAERERLRAALHRLSVTGRGALPLDEYREWVKEVADEALATDRR